jgi:tetratricopeptide (TPR) repeat protein
MTERFVKIRELFEASLEIAAEGRLNWLSAACQGDAELEREVQALLQVNDQNRFLDEPIWSRKATHPERFGPYEILDEIGHGGMGTVYRALRSDGVFRKVVAVKVMAGGGWDRALATRFQRERQILARLEHPHIARILDGGSVNGVPYLVMEYVEGERIDQYCKTRQLGVGEKIDLYAQVCDAVDYAHRNLIVHRDLKPPNVLVTADGTVKLLDFGIAKMLSGDGDSELTVTLQLTPDYASPEQLRGELITTAMDVYSLGVMLFELLTNGARPYSSHGNLAEMVRTVAAEGAPAPSTMAPPALRGQLHGDLDSIVGQALAIDPQRRYASAGRMADDLRRHQAGLPVSAHADSRAYRARKFVRRHWVWLSAVAAVLMALLLTAAVTFEEKKLALREAAEATRQRLIAERRYEDVRSLATSILFDIHDQVKGLAGASEVRRVAVTKALQYLDALYQQGHSDDVALEGDLAGAFERAGDILGNISDSSVEGAQSALPPYLKALELRRQVVLRRPGDHAARELLARAHEKVGVGYLGLGRARDAIASFNEASRLMGSDVSFRAEILDRQASGYAALTDFERSMQYCREALVLVQSMHPVAAAAPDQLTARITRQYGILLRVAGKNEQAIPWLRQAADMLRALMRQEPDRVIYRRQYATLLPMLAKAYEDRGQAQEADKVWTEARSTLTAMIPASPKDPQIVLSLAYTLREIAWKKYHAHKQGKTTETGEAEMALSLTYSERMAARTQAGAHEIIEYADTLLKTPYPNLRNPKRALEFALRGNTLSDNRNPLMLDTLAWAYYRTGSTQAAIQTMEKARDLLSPSAANFRKEYEDALRQFHAADSSK